MVWEIGIVIQEFNKFIELILEYNKWCENL
jgi:hypothetical protein